MLYEHVDTRISSLSYIKLKRLDNDIKIWTRGHTYLLAQLYKIKTFG